MKNVTRICAFVVVVCTSIINLFACQNPHIAERLPNNYPGTAWKSTDGNIDFGVGYEDTIYLDCKTIEVAPYFQTISSNTRGTIKAGNETYEFFAIFNLDFSVEFISADIQEVKPKSYEEADRAISDDYLLLVLRADYKSKSYFEAKVIGGPLFEKGTQFQFRKYAEF